MDVAIKINTPKRGRSPNYTESPAARPTEGTARSEHSRAAHTFQCLSDRVAKQTFHYQNWFSPDLKAKYPNEPRTWHVGRKYPYAVGYESKGPLYVDEPRNGYDRAACAQKAEFFKSIKARYLLIESDTTYEDALIQLGEL